MKVYSSVKDPMRKTGNSGDLFSYYIAEKIYGSDFLRLGVEDRASFDGSTFCFVGSILQWMPKNTGVNIYGCGFIEESSNPLVLQGNNLLGVRGYYSQYKARKVTGLSVPVVSDPGLLVSEIFSDFSDQSPNRDFGLVIHGVDRVDFFKKHPNLKLYLIDNYGDFSKYINDLRKCKFVITSSLHGAVFCHSLGIPVAVINVAGNLIGGDYKFRDYYSSFGIDFKFFDIDLISDLSGLGQAVLEYPQPSNLILNNYKNMQLHDIDFILNNKN